MYRLVPAQHRFFNRRAIDKCAVRGTKVLNDDFSALDDDLAMRAGYGRISDFEVVGEATANHVCAGLEFNFPSLR